MTRIYKIGTLHTVIIGLMLMACLAMLPDTAHAIGIDPPPGPAGREGEGPWSTYGRLEISPFIGAFMFSGDLDTDMALGGGLRFGPTVVGWEVPGVVDVYIDYAFTRTDITDHVIIGGGGATETLTGNVHHISVNVGIVTPDVEDGGLSMAINEDWDLKTIVGVGLGGFFFQSFENTDTIDDAFFIHFTPWVETEFRYNQEWGISGFAKFHMTMAEEPDPNAAETDEVLFHNVFEVGLAAAFYF